MKTRRKRSVIWSVPHDELQNLLDTSDSIVDVLEKLGFDGHAGNHRTLKRRFNDEQFDFTQLNINRRISRTDRLNARLKQAPVLDSEIFIERSDASFSTVKKRIKTQSLLEYRCVECGNIGFHNDKPLSLQVDHINGINTDHRLENLRYLCPNCHSQTETFSGKRHRKDKVCSGCGTNTSHHSHKLCKSCFIDNTKDRPDIEKIKWPSNDVLSSLVWDKPMVQIGKILGVSDVAVKKRCKKHNISVPPRGFWLKTDRRVE